ncbi:MAG: hypothetical protein ABJB49_05040 [Nitrospirota bacterium]
MMSNLNGKGRIWILLMAWILFTGLSVADMFDLSDDIALPTALGQLAVPPAFSDDPKPHVFALKVFTYGGEFDPLSLIGEGDVPLMFSMPFVHRDTPLYQRHSAYRI